MASDGEELYPSYREDTGASTVWSLGHAYLRVVNRQCAFPLHETGWWFVCERFKSKRWMEALGQARQGVRSVPVSVRD